MSRDSHRLSFDSVAEAYERSRPLYAPDALAWIAARLPLHRVLDLAAGTGKLTRQLVELGADVVAVEPGAEMRAMLERVVPGVDALAGSAEAIPLADASVDAVTVAQAFHWFDADAALAEIHRVLRPGGGVALLWNEWDDADPLLHELDGVVARRRPAWWHAEGKPDWQQLLESTPLFDSGELRTFRHADRLEPELVVERISSTSCIAAAAPADREQALAEVRGLLGDDPVDFALITTVAIADRV